MLSLSHPLGCGSLHRGKTTITEPSVCMSSRHRNHGAPCEVARDNISPSTQMDGWKDGKTERWIDGTDTITSTADTGGD